MSISKPILWKWRTDLSLQSLCWKEIIPTGAASLGLTICQRDVCPLKPLASMLWLYIPSQTEHWKSALCQLLRLRLPAALEWLVSQICALPKTRGYEDWLCCSRPRSLTEWKKTWLFLNKTRDAIIMKIKFIWIAYAYNYAYNFRDTTYLGLSILFLKCFGIIWVSPKCVA